MFLAKMNYREVEEYLKTSDAVIIPVGSLENHGLHLPLGTDALIPEEIARRVEQALNENYPEAQLLLQVHDELIVECPEEIADQVAALVSREMQGIAALNVPLTAEAKCGKSWYDAK